MADSKRERFMHFLAGIVGPESLPPLRDPVAKIADPAGGTTIDAEARAAINSIIDALEAHGLSSE